MISHRDVSNDAIRPDVGAVADPSAQPVSLPGRELVAEALAQRFRQAGEGAEVAVLREVLLDYLTRGST